MRAPVRAREVSLPSHVGAPARIRLGRIPTSFVDFVPACAGLREGSRWIASRIVDGFVSLSVLVRVP